VLLPDLCSPSVPAAVLQHDMQLLVAPDRPSLLLELSQQLARYSCCWFGMPFAQELCSRGRTVWFT
jgi:hypothetical protein